MTIQTMPGRSVAASARGVTAVLGPTNTGKTHLAIERMLAHSSGVIGLPLRLLAREVYNRVVERVGADAVALVTGEEKIVPKNARFRVCTVEALPNSTDASFLAIDEIQIAADLERGHVFTDRILNLRGRDETLLLGAATMRNVIEKLIPGINVVTRPRMSVLTYSGSKKITRLPRRSAAVAFSADEVYAIGELIRRQRGGVAVVLGALSPRTRNAQVELFQNGDVDFLVATDAIGMGLNLDLDHVAFASDRKFDGYQFRRLTPSEFGQVAGRAGRHMKDGTFGVTGRVDPLEDELVEALESHRFDTIKAVQWRTGVVDYSSLEALRDSLEQPPQHDGLVKAPPAEDLRVLEAAIRTPEIAALADRPARVELLWDVCQLPDYRRIAPANHADLVLTVYGYLVRDGAINEDWFADQIAHADHIDGDIDTLSNRIAHIRTWNYAANRSNWLANQVHWQERSRAIEDRLSDALHERLIQRFVDRRTSVLMRRLRENAMLEAEITENGDVTVEGQHIGQLQGFRFFPDPGADGPEAKALRAAAQKALAGEIKRRADGIANAGNEQFALASDGSLRWRGIPVARLVAGKDDPLKPRLILLADEGLTGPDQEAVSNRLDIWINNHCQTLLKPLYDLRGSDDLPPAARGLAYRLAEAFGVLERKEVSEEVRGLEQDVRATLRQLGVRFGAYHIYVPQLLKPAPSSLLAMLWGLVNDGLDTPGVAELPALSAAGRTTIPYDPAMPKPLYQVVGYQVTGERAVRIDILERLADQIRPLLSWRPNASAAVPPEGTVPGGGFTVTPQMTSLLGASVEGVGSVLRSLGYRSEKRPAPVPAPTDETTSAGETIPAAEAPPAAEQVAPPAMDGSSEAGAPEGHEQPLATDASATVEMLAEKAEDPTEGLRSELDAALAALSGGDAESEADTIAADSAPAPAGEHEAPSAESDDAASPTAPSATAEAAAIDDGAAAEAPSAVRAPDGPAPEASAEPAVATAADAPALADEEPAAAEAETTAPEAAAAEADPEPVFIEVWRPQRNQGRGGPRAHDGARQGRRQRDGVPAQGEKQGERQGQGRGKGRPSDARPPRRGNASKPDKGPQRKPQEERRPRQPARIDPDSPFAALASLKADLEGRKKD